MSYVRVYENRIDWHNYPNVTTPLDEINLNKMDYALHEIDGTLENWDTTKADESDMLLAVKTITFNDENGQITITFFNGTSTVIDTLLEKVAVNFDYDDDPTSAHYQSLIITLDDGTVKYVDLSALITQYEFIDSSTMHFTVNQDGEITVDIIDGSITEAKLRPQFLADCIAAKNAAQTAQAGAETAEDNAEGFSEDSEAWATGKRNGQDVDLTDPTYHNNAKYWSEQANPTTLVGMSDVDINPEHVAKGDILINDGENWSNYPSTDNKGIAIGSNSIASGENSIAFGWGLASGANSISRGGVMINGSPQGTSLPPGSISEDSPITVQASLQLPIINGVLTPLSNITSSPLSALNVFSFSGGVRCQNTSASPVSSTMSFSAITNFDRLVTNVFNQDLSLTSISLTQSAIVDLFGGMHPISWKAIVTIGSASADCRLYLDISSCVIEKTVDDELATLSVSVILTPDISPESIQGTTITWRNSSLVAYGTIYTLVRPVASGSNAIALGGQSIASGNNSFASGYNAQASGSVTFAEGYNVVASGYYSRAEGYNTQSSGQCSHSTGEGTISDKRGMFSCGVYNKATQADETNYDLLQVGCGLSSGNRKNAFTVRKDGTIGASAGLGIQLKTDNTKAIKFGVDDYGNYGYIKDGADTVIPFRNVVPLGFWVMRSVGRYTKSASSVSRNIDIYGYWAPAIGGVIASQAGRTSSTNYYRDITIIKNGWYAVKVYTTGAITHGVYIHIKDKAQVTIFADTVARDGYLVIDRENNTGEVKLNTDATNLNEIEYSYLEEGDIITLYCISHTTSSYIYAEFFYRYDGSFDRWDSELSEPVRVL